jgi:hypothetical protein
MLVTLDLVTTRKRAACLQCLPLCFTRAYFVCDLHTCTHERTTHTYFCSHFWLFMHAHMNAWRTQRFVLIFCVDACTHEYTAGTVSFACMHACTHEHTTHIIWFSFLVDHTRAHENMTRAYTYVSPWFSCTHMNARRGKPLWHSLCP